MRHRNASLARLLLTALAHSLLLGSLVDCGGSAAETPEPVRPDDWQLRLRQAHQAPVQSGRADDGSILLGRDLDSPRSVRSTWGSGRKPVAPAARSTTVPTPVAAPTGTNEAAPMGTDEAIPALPR